MKRPAIINENGPIYVCRSLDHLIAKHNHIGFESEEGDRYFIIRSGLAAGLAVTPEDTYTTLEKQEKITHGYYVFDNYEELCQWVGEAL